MAEEKSVIYFGLQDRMSARNYTLYSTTIPGICMVYNIIRATQMVYNTERKWVTINNMRNCNGLHRPLGTILVR
jgi:hypothetical protein